MQFTSQVEVLGMAPSKGEVEGYAYDSTKVFIKLDLSGQGKGFASDVFKLGDSSMFDRYKHLSFPFVANAEYIMTTNGSKSKLELVSLTPLELKKA